MESITRLGGFTALKKTPEAPYTTKVNYRGRTSRGTTPLHPLLTLYTAIPGWVTVQQGGSTLARAQRTATAENCEKDFVQQVRA